MTIRGARPEDAPAVMAFARTVPELEASAETRFVENEEFEEWAQSPKENICLVAVEDDEVIGFLNARIMSRLWCYLDNLAVNPRHRGAGVGTAMLSRLEAELRSRSIRYISGLAGKEHGRTRAYWKKQGFAEGKEFVWIEKTL